MKRWRQAGALVVAGVAMADAVAVETPWVMVGRRAVGRIQHMTQSETNGGPGYDVATVVLKADPDKVYATALKAVQASTQVRLTVQDAQQRRLEFTDGKQTAGLRVSGVDGQLAQLLITSVRLPNQTSATSLVLTGVMRVCKDMGVECSVGP
jgi:hypothetical protein